MAITKSKASQLISTLGMNPSFLKKLSKDQAEAYIKKSIATTLYLYHPDKTQSTDQKAIQEVIQAKELVELVGWDKIHAALRQKEMDKKTRTAFLEKKVEILQEQVKGSIAHLTTSFQSGEYFLAGLLPNAANSFILLREPSLQFGKQESIPLEEITNSFLRDENNFEYTSQIVRETIAKKLETTKTHLLKAKKRHLAFISSYSEKLKNYRQDIDEYKTHLQAIDSGSIDWLHNYFSSFDTEISSNLDMLLHKTRNTNYVQTMKDTPQVKKVMLDRKEEQIRNDEFLYCKDPKKKEQALRSILREKEELKEFTKNQPQRIINHIKSVVKYYVSRKIHYLEQANHNLQTERETKEQKLFKLQKKYDRYSQAKINTVDDLSCFWKDVDDSFGKLMIGFYDSLNSEQQKIFLAHETSQHTSNNVTGKHHISPLVALYVGSDLSISYMPLGDPAVTLSLKKDFIPTNKYILGVIPSEKLHTSYDSESTFKQLRTSRSDTIDESIISLDQLQKMNFFNALSPIIEEEDPFKRVSLVSVEFAEQPIYRVEGVVSSGYVKNIQNATNLRVDPYLTKLVKG